MHKILRQFCSLIALLIFTAAAFAQARTITGRVSSDRSNEPLQGVTVTSADKVTTTKANRTYFISIDGNVTLVFTAIGFETQEIQTGTQSQINVTLISSAKSLEDVVVIGYGRQKKSDLTGSVVSLRSGDFNKGSTNTSVAQLIQGRAAGVQVTQSSGAPGGGVSIRIR